MLTISAQHGTEANHLSRICLGQDRLRATQNADFIVANRCELTEGVILEGFDGDDVISGSQYPDERRGGPGSDLLVGDLGADKIWGGPAGDIFVIASQDYIDGVINTFIDFDCSEGDTIDLRHVLNHDFYSNELSLDRKREFFRLETDSETDDYSFIWIDADGGQDEYRWTEIVKIKHSEMTNLEDMIENSCVDFY